MPMLSRRNPSGIPAAPAASAVKCACDVNRGSETSESTPPRLGAWRMMLELADEPLARAHAAGQLDRHHAAESVERRYGDSWSGWIGSPG